MKTALITGITGHDGSYLTELLLEKGYLVHGIKRRDSRFLSQKLNHLFFQQPPKEPRIQLHYGDLTDSSSIIRIIQNVQPDEIYNLAAQSSVHVSFELPEYTTNSDGLGTLRLLEAIRILGLGKKTRFYQASTSELFGRTEKVPQNEETNFYPRSPYGVAKLYAYWIVKNYRESYGIYACNGILFNHESPRRGESYVTRKITRAVGRIKHGLQKRLNLGNLNALRDWGFAGDYVEGMWKMLQQDSPEDFVLATGRMVSVREFCRLAFERAGIRLRFEGEGVDEKGIDQETDEVVLAVDPQFFRPAEVGQMQGDARKAKRLLGWEPKVSLEEIINMMVDQDLVLAEKEKHIKVGGFEKEL
jgi:GDPmannose 4,6-dehydratase